MKSVIAISILSASFVLVAASPSIPENGVTMTQDSRTRLVTVAYTLENAPAIVTLDIQTNGVSIGHEKFQNLGGSVNVKVQPGTHTITWHPEVEWDSLPQRISAEGVKAVVKAWACDAPPPYLVVDLVVTNALRFYSCAEAVPGGITNNPAYRRDKLVMRRIPAANVTWRMGSPSTEPLGNTTDTYSNFAAREIPHYVMLTNDYYMGVFEVTQKQFSYFSDATTYGYATYKGDALPMETVSFSHIRGSGVSWPADGHTVAANSPIDRLRRISGVDFDLPTDAQWEYACRAGTSTGLNSGKECDSSDENIKSISWFYDNSAEGYSSRRTHEVGLKEPNAWGLYDMHGNVEEFCLDYMTTGDDYVATFGEGYEQGDTVVEPIGSASGETRIVRGGNFSVSPRYQRSARRTTYASNSPRANTRGFRLWCPADF